MFFFLGSFFYLFFAAVVADDSVVTLDNVDSQTLEEEFLIGHPFPICDFQPNKTGYAQNRSSIIMPQRDEGGVQSIQFLKDLQKKVLDSLRTELAYTNRVIGCYQSADLENLDDSCKDAFTFEYSNLEEVGCNDDLNSKTMSLYQLISVARRSLAIASSPSSMTAAKVILPHLRHPGVSKEVAWDPLTSEERQQAQELYDKYIRLAEDERIKNSNPFATTTHKALLGRAESALRVYREIMDQNPILQFISSAKPDRNELINAAKKVRERAVDEISRVESMSSYWTRDNERLARRRKSNRGGHWGFDPKALKLIEYETITEQLLASKPEYCSILKMALDAEGNRERNTNRVILLGSTAFGLVTAGLGSGVALFGGLSVGFGMAGSEVFAAYKADQLNRKTAAVSIKNKCGALARSNQTLIDKERRELVSRSLEAPLVSVTGASSGAALGTIMKHASHRGSKLYHLIKKTNK